MEFYHEDYLEGAARAICRIANTHPNMEKYLRRLEERDKKYADLLVDLVVALEEVDEYQRDVYERYANDVSASAAVNELLSTQRPPSDDEQQ